jgi:hypothetical protein
MNDVSSSEGNLNLERRRARRALLQDGLQHLQSVARERNGECLDTAYSGPQSYYKFRCAEGHEWEQTAAKTFQGNWCKTCVRLERQTPLGVMHAIAASRGGRCLSVETQTAKGILTWKCRLGHVWEARPVSIRHGAWCPECAALERQKLRANHVRDAALQSRARAAAADPSLHPALARLREYASRLGWRCLAQAWSGYYTHYEFECANGHRQMRAGAQFLFGKRHRPRCAQCESSQKTT